MVSGGKVLCLYSWTADILARTPLAWSRCGFFFLSICSSAQRGLDVNVTSDNSILCTRIQRNVKGFGIPIPVFVGPNECTAVLKKLCFLKPLLMLQCSI